jgi:carbon-monoxide dehydrogenase small subunit
MTVNGAPVSGEVEGRTLLVEFLRDQLRLTGTHVGCDTSQCGACVVHVDGLPVKACTALALDVAGAEVVTIEGLAAPDGALSDGAGGVSGASRAAMRLLHAGHDHVGHGALRENPTPTEAEVREYLEGNICRCTGYHNIVKAILAASGQDVSGIAAE